MGFLRPVFSVAGMSIEYALLSILDLAAERASPPGPGVDDVMGSLFMNDSGNGVGTRYRPDSQVTIRAKISTWTQQEEQVLDQTGLDPESELLLTLFDEDLIAANLLVDGVLKVKADDRLLKIFYSDGIQSSSGVVRYDYTRNGALPGLRCKGILPGITGEGAAAGRQRLLFESQRVSEAGLQGAR